MTDNKPTITAVFLSKTSNEAIYQMTLNACETLRKSSSEIVDLETVIMESGKGEGISNYPQWITTITPDAKFNFHQFLNIGVQSKPADWYLLCNNDIEFAADAIETLFAQVLKHPEIQSWSPRCPLSQKQAQLFAGNEQAIVQGYSVAGHLSGWCIMISRQAYESIGGLDEAFSFYFADNDYAFSLRKHDVRHALVKASLVKHLEHQKVSKDLSKMQVLTVSPPWYTHFSNFKYIARSDAMVAGHKIFTDKWGFWLVSVIKAKLHDFLVSKCGIKNSGKYLF